MEIIIKVLLTRIVIPNTFSKEFRIHINKILIKELQISYMEKQFQKNISYTRDYNYFTHVYS